MTTIHVGQPTDAQSLPPGHFLLAHDGWNDWWEYETLYLLRYKTPANEIENIGWVKVASKEFEGRVPKLEKIITKNNSGTFSLGQDVSYYKNLRAIVPEEAETVLKLLGDIAYSDEIRRRVYPLGVTTRSLLRSVGKETLEGQLKRASRGGAMLTPYDFKFSRQESSRMGAVELQFAVKPDSQPPTNLQILIGRNGAGKSTLLTQILNTFQNREKLGVKITNLVVVSFSAFDFFGTPLEAEGAKRPVEFIGLKKPMEDPFDPTELKSDVDLGAELKKSLTECMAQPRRSRLIRAIEILENDPIFAESKISESLASERTPKEIINEVAEKYWRLSSGHRIVFLTTTRLVDSVREKSLVLIDEPEAHLHPPLLSAYMRALSDLLIDRNGLAIIATHSPVVLQEVPRSCVWKVTRSGRQTAVARPDIETFGENVGTLTHEIFGLEVEGTGFYRLLRDMTEDLGSYKAVLKALDNQLGKEGRGLLRAMTLLAEEGVSFE
ncbi:AAA family ATPase [Luteococcus sp. Sow4_B9]|uniref:AAA family ATPase n=1 Tax=Luteococcus sp. Sow4_B9 TaxID=3438792 RepID=UPI003F9963DE